jgi:spermidine/putrescine transport system substrate-binding protein
MKSGRGLGNSAAQLLGGIVFAASVAGVASSVASAELRVLNWKGWGTDEPWAVAHFEQRSGVTVVHDYITSFQEMFTKLRTNPGYYDVVDLSAPFTMQAAQEGLIQPADVAKLEHFKDLFADMRESPRFQQGDDVWGVAWIWGGTTVSYDTDTFQTPPTSIQVLWDPAHANRVCWRDDPEDSVRFAAMATDQDPDDPADMEAIREKLRALKPQIKAFWQSEDEWLKLIGAKECDLSIIWTTSVENARVRHDLPVSLIVPEEGAIAVADGLSIARDAPNPEAAHAFIDYMISPDFYAGWVEAGGAPVPANAKAAESAPEDSLTRQILTKPDVIERLNFKGPLSDEQRQAYLDLWQETKAYFAE